MAILLQEDDVAEEPSDESLYESEEDIDNKVEVGKKETIRALRKLKEELKEMRNDLKEF
jgi:hypothetical protein